MWPPCRLLLRHCTLIVMSYCSVPGGGAVPIETKIILSSHNFESTPTDKALETTLEAMWAAGADVAKIATTANDITDCARVLTLLKTSQGMSRKYRKERSTQSGSIAGACVPNLYPPSLKGLGWATTVALALVDNHRCCKHSLECSWTDLFLTYLETCLAQLSKCYPVTNFTVLLCSA